MTLPKTVSDLPDPLENPAIWFKAYAALPSADGGPGLAETLAVPGGSLWWMVDYWAYIGGLGGCRLYDLLRESSTPPRVKKTVYIRKWVESKGKVYREVLRNLLGGEIKREIEPNSLLISVYSAGWTTVLTKGKTLVGDIHLATVVDRLQNLGEHTIVLERDTKRSFSLKHPSRPSYYLPAHQMLNVKFSPPNRVIWKSCQKKLIDYKPPFVDEKFQSWIEGIIRDLLSGRLQEAFTWYSSAIQFLKAFRPKAVLVIDEGDMFGRCLITAANSLGIETVALQHGILWKDHYAYVNPASILIESLAWRLPLPDQTCVYGDRFRDILLSNGNYPQDAVIVTGVPRHDSIEHIAEMGETIYEKIGLVEGESYCVLLSQPFPLVIRERIVELAIAAAQASNSVLVVKLHSGDNAEKMYIKKIKECGIDGRLVQDIDLLKILASAEYAIAGNSTAIIEAACLGIDVIMTEIPGVVDALDFIELGAVLPISHLDDAYKLFPLSTEQKEKLAMGRNTVLRAYMKKTRHATESVVDVLLNKSWDRK